jgi:hypothetical protein
MAHRIVGRHFTLSAFGPAPHLPVQIVAEKLARPRNALHQDDHLPLLFIGCARPGLLSVLIERLWLS